MTMQYICGKSFKVTYISIYSAIQQKKTKLSLLLLQIWLQAILKVIHNLF